MRYEEFAPDDIYLAQYEQTGDAVTFAEEYAAFFLAAFQRCTQRSAGGGTGRW